MRWLPSNLNYFVLVFKNVFRILRSKMSLQIFITYLETYQIIYICCFDLIIVLYLPHKFEYNEYN